MSTKKEAHEALRRLREAQIKGKDATLREVTEQVGMHVQAHKRILKDLITVVDYLLEKEP